MAGHAIVVGRGVRLVRSSERAAKISCTFCSYANGLIVYVREVAACTEEYWCPIRHARAVVSPHERYNRFFDYGDGERYHGELMSLRRSMREPAQDPPTRGARGPRRSRGA